MWPIKQISKDLKFLNNAHLIDLVAFIIKVNSWANRSLLLLLDKEIGLIFFKENANFL